MTNYNQEIDSIVEKAVTEKTFSLEIVDQIKQLKELPEKLEKAEERISELTKKNTELTTNNNTLVAKADDVTNRELAVIQVEKKQEITNVENKWKEKMLYEYKEMMSLVFRNQAIKKSTCGVMPVSNVNNGYTEIRQEGFSADTVETLET